MSAQKENLIVTKITQPGKPTIQQITEAGIIGKIGFNSAGVGTCLNAIRVHGVDPTRMPVHFGLRMALESNSAIEAVEKLEGYGMASSAHILIADPSTAVSLEFTKSTFARCAPDSSHRLVHANHMLLHHSGEVDTIWLKDSLARVETMAENCAKLGKDSHEPSWEEVNRLFEDEQNYPTAICRDETAVSGSGTLFNIVMDLKSNRAVIRIGRPVSVDDTVKLSF
jgi:isopenicillin-N N-acyltransferase-like protein